MHNDLFAPISSDFYYRAFTGWPYKTLINELRWTIECVREAHAEGKHEHAWEVFQIYLKRRDAIKRLKRDGLLK